MITCNNFVVHTKKIRIRNQIYVRGENKDDIFGKLKYSNRIGINISLALNKVLSEIVLGKNNEYIIYDQISVGDRSITIDMALFPFGVALSSPRISYCSQLKETVHHFNLIFIYLSLIFFIKFSFLFRCYLSSIYDDVTCLYTPFFI